ncbi:hypothetical protein QUC31_008460 [Theobroma cacao]
MMDTKLNLLIVVALVSIQSHLQFLPKCVEAAKSNVHIVYMGEKKHQDPATTKMSHHKMLSTLLGSKEAAKNSMLYSYKHGFSGFAARLTESQAEEIAAFPGVVHVIPNRIHRLHTTRSWEFMGLKYHSSKNLLTQSNMGEGTIIGVIDSDRAFATAITLGNNLTLWGQSVDTGIHNHGFTGITFSDRIAANSSDDSASDLSFDVADISSAAISVLEAGGVGLIFAQYRSDGLGSCHHIPCIKVDYEVGTQILSYIRKARSPIAKLSIPKTVIGKWIYPRVADFSARGPSSISPALLKCKTAASQTRTDGSNIAEEGSTRKAADPFDIGGGLVNPNKAVNPGLIYDAGIEDYVQFLCGTGYSSKAVTGLTQTQVNCTKSRLNVLNLNLPSITIPNLKRKVTVTRAVTNVGPVDSVYKAIMQAPQGIKLKVEPQILSFNKTTQILPFKVTFFSTRKVSGDYRFGSLSWTDGKHIVRSPISVRAILFESYVDT